MFVDMCSKILNSLLKNPLRVLNSNEYRTIYRNISKTIPLLPGRVGRIPVYKTEETVQTDLLESALAEGNVPSTQEWPEVKNKVLSEGKYINNVNFDARAISYCIAFKNFGAAKSLLLYYQSKNENLNIGALGKFMKLCYVCNEDKGAISEEDEEIILSTYKLIREQYPILTTITAENLIPALSLTKEWKKCLDLLADIKLTIQPSGGSYSAIIKTAFENNEFDLGWKLIHEMSSEGKLPNPLVYQAWLKKITESKDDVIKNVELLLKYFAEYEVLPTKEVTNQIVNTLKLFFYTGTYSGIAKKGICKCCKNELQEIKINDDEFNELKTVFMNNVIIGKNIFTKTNPEELDKFKEFLSSAKYDMVIDGLNVAYSAGNKQRPEVYARLLSNIVRHYRLKNRKILVLGRLHMNKWPKQYMDYIKSHSKMFLAENISQDDPFLLYATMSNGLGTSFVSRDFMRGHLYLLMDRNLKKIFRRWQQLHQHSFIYTRNDGNVHVKNPFPYLCTTQECKTGWHIPYVDIYYPMPPTSFEPPTNWLCIQKT